MWCNATYPLSNRTSSRALPLSACIHHLLNPDGIPLLSIPTQGKRQFIINIIILIFFIWMFMFTSAVVVWSHSGFSSDQITLMPDSRTLHLHLNTPKRLYLMASWLLIWMCALCLSPLCSRQFRSETETRKEKCEITDLLSQTTLRI